MNRRTTSRFTVLSPNTTYESAHCTSTVVFQMMCCGDKTKGKNSVFKCNHPQRELYKILVTKRILPIDTSNLMPTLHTITCV